MKTVVMVSNIKCESCATTIEKALCKFIGVENVSINKLTDEIIITHGEEVSREKIVEKLLSLGYPEEGNVHGINAVKVGAKSFASCVVGRIDDLKNKD